MNQEIECPVFGFYAASRKLIGLYTKELESLGITYPQHLVITCLLMQDGLSVDAIGEKLFLDSGTLTPLLKRLEKNGFITRKVCADDERKKLIFLTKKGKGCEVHLEALKEKMRAKLTFTQEERKRFRHLLNKIIKTL
jgi:DNA-binding MarR family transcriptional regulator